MIRAKRRYIHRSYHPAFGYYIGARVVKEQATHKVENNAPGMFGRPDLNSVSTESDLPLVWNEAEAREFFIRQEPFAFITTRGKAGFQDADSYKRHENEQPDFTVVTDCYDLIVKQKKVYV